MEERSPGTGKIISRLLSTPQDLLATLALGNTFANAGKEAKSVGQLWLLKLAPVNEGNVVSKSRLRTVLVHAGDAEADAACCALGVCKDEKRGLEVLIYGKDKEPLTRVPIKTVSGQQDKVDAVELGAEVPEARL